MNRRLTAAACLAALVLAGCESTGNHSSGGAAVDAGLSNGPFRGTANVPTPADGATTAGASGAPGTAIVIGVAGGQIERLVTASYLVSQGGFLSSFNSVTARAVAMGGYVVSSTTQPDSRGRMVSGGAVVKVPAAKLADYLNGMPSTFSPSSINFSSVDHTAAFVDVTARLAASRAHLAALVTLLSRAANLADITALEQQIAGVQSEIDSEQGQLDVINGAVAMATATVQLGERGAEAATPAPVSPVSSGVSGGWSNAVEVTGAILNGAFTGLPLLVLLGLGWLAWRPLARWRRRSQRSAPAAS